MQELISYRFELGASDTQVSRADILRECADWAWSRTGDAAPDVVGQPSGHIESDPDHVLTWWSAELPEEAVAGTEVELRHPAWNDPGLQWRVTMLLLTRSDGLSLSIRVGREATTFKLQPAALEFGPPRIVRQLVETQPCFAGVLGIAPEPVRLGPSEVEGTLLATLELTPPDRVLPVLVVDRAGRVDTEGVARQLYGLAHVVGLSGFLAHRRLRELLPDAYVPRNGMRLYWPGFGDPASTLHHPYWTSGRLAGLADPIGSVLFEMLARLSVTRVPVEPLRARLRSAARSRDGLDSISVEDWEDFVKEFEAQEIQIEELAAQVKRLRSATGEDELRRLRSQLEIERNNVQALLASNRSSPAGVAELETIAAGPSTWAELVARLDDLEADSEGALLLTDTARRSARESGYTDPPRIFEYLEKLSVAASEYRRRDGRLDAALKDWLREEHQLHCAPHDSNLRSKEYGGKKDWSKVWHVKVDDAKHGPVNVGRIYFEPIFEPGVSRFEVWHVGSKLV